MEKNKRRIQSLSHRSQFLALKQQGRAFHVNSWLMVNVCSERETEIIRCGWTIPRQVGPAVVRNRLRRWGREYLRKWSKELRPGGLSMNVIFKRKEKTFYRALSHKEFDEGMEKLVGRIERLAH